MTRELWRYTKRSNRYEVSSLGRVRLTKSRTILKPHRREEDGRYYVRLTVVIDSKKRRIRVGVHILVAESFIKAKPHPKAYIKFKDGQSDNIKPANLEWVIPSSKIPNRSD